MSSLKLLFAVFFVVGISLVFYAIGYLSSPQAKFFEHGIKNKPNQSNVIFRMDEKSVRRGDKFHLKLTHEYSSDTIPVFLNDSGYSKLIQLTSGIYAWSYQLIFHDSIDIKKGTVIINNGSKTTDTVKIGK